MKYQSFDEWRKEGYTVNKGEHSKFKNRGIYMFGADQVVPWTQGIRKAKIKKAFSVIRSYYAQPKIS